MKAVRIFLVKIPEEYLVMSNKMDEPSFQKALKYVK